MTNCKTALLKKGSLPDRRADGQLLVRRWRTIELTTGTAWYHRGMFVVPIR
ncbi:hypothetical protein NDI37_25910 [Funiculus sociatus GB2-A5]|uniref:Uncharacterized protein n=1 Tax=Funiculus sociatus GB2-A5 TaxID=2933946 RepID=A0ABV0JWQ4_9CYAN|nr:MULTISPECIES: hypothetical protein [unclassified Trichocoleus]MBD1906299.1 hypothetical protein [Trichocoleus sp. FACHB-832]MBD2063169.1 hypothetical protein [Trichocoleus sp. FACHB-6]